MKSATTNHIGLRLALVAILLLAYYLRVFQLTEQSIWWDEGISLNLARSSLADIIADRVNNIHPPLYFIILKFWTTLTGLNAFSGRYLSVLASFLQVSTVFAVCRHWFAKGKPEGSYRLLDTGPGAWIALIFITISPLSIIYGQEIRVYAVLPLIGLALLALAWHMSDHPRVATRYFVLLGVAEWLGLHLHYVVAFVIGYAGLWLLIVVFRQRRWHDLRRFLGIQLLVGLFSVPWFVAVLRNLSAVRAEANAGTYLTDPVPVDFLLKQIWVFHHTGLAGSLARLNVWGLSLLILGLTLVLLVERLRRTAFRNTAVRLLLQWFVPLTGALLVWNVRSFSHPRYISFTAVGFIILVAYLIYPGRMEVRGWNRLLRLGLSGMLILSLAAISLLGLNLYFFNPDFSKDDMRGVARLLEEVAIDGDLIIVPDTDWSLPFEYRGDADIVMPGLPDRPMMWVDMEAWTAVPRRVFTVRYDLGNRDWQNVVPFVLEAAGSPRRSWQLEDLTVREYHVTEPIRPPAFLEKDVWFGPLQLTGVWLEPDPLVNTAVAAALQWQPTANMEATYQVKLRLLDSDGFVLAEKSDLLLEEDGRPTNRWQPNQPIITYHHVPLPPGTAPVPFQLELSLFSAGESEIDTLNAIDEAGAPLGQQLLVAEGELGLDTALTESAYEVPNHIPPYLEETSLSPGLRLLGAVLERKQVRPGQSLFVHLQWLAERPLSPLTPVLQLMQNGKAIAASETSATLENYPLDLWQPGLAVNDHRRLSVPPSAAGTAVVAVVVGDEMVELGEVEISGLPRQMTPPAMANETNVTFAEKARLVGFDLEVSGSETVLITLYWQSLVSDMDTEYKVFTHVLGEDGQLVGQHDAAPNNGQRPTTGWLEGEYITDPHTIQLDRVSGPVRVAIGLYDPQSNERLVLADGTDFYILPEEITLNN